MSKSNIVLNNVVLINNGRAADFLKWIHFFNLYHSSLMSFTILRYMPYILCRDIYPFR